MSSYFSDARFARNWTLKPLEDRVVIQQAKTPTKIGRIHIPASAREPLLYGSVIAVGPKVKSPLLLPGVLVIYDLYAGTLVSDERFMMLREEDIYGVIELEDAQEARNWRE